MSNNLCSNVGHRQTIVYDFGVSPGPACDQSPPTHCDQWPVYQPAHQVHNKIMHTITRAEGKVYKEQLRNIGALETDRWTTFASSPGYRLYRICTEHGSWLFTGWQCMERNLIVITFPADFISLLGHDVLEDGIWYLFRCVDCAPRPCPAPHHPVPYGHKLAHNLMPGC